MMPSSSDLSYFVEVGTSLNLSRAAERLGISQPSLTLSMQRLEHTIGAPLLIRSKRGVVLTQAGKQLLIHTRELLQTWETVKGGALASQNEVQGHYSIGCHPAVALYSLPGFMPDLLESFPHLEIKLNHDLSRKVAESVIRMETDLGIVVNPVRHPDLMIRKLCDDEVTLWAGKGRRKIQDISSGEAVLICEPELQQTQDLLQKLDRAKIRFRRIVTSSNLDVITQLVASGAGVGILPGRVVNASGDSLKKVPGAPVFHDEISLLYRVENRSVRAIQEIADRISRFFKQN